MSWSSTPRPVASVTQHPVVADEGRLVRLRRFDGTLLDALLEGFEGTQVGDGAGAVRRPDHEMDERAVRKAQHHVTDAVRHLPAQFGEHAFDQLLVLVGPVGRSFVAYQG